MELLIKAMICVTQAVCLYQLFAHNRMWVVFVQMIMAGVAMVI